MHSDLPEILRMLAALAFVLALMGGLVLVLRKLGFAAQGHSPGNRRLKVVEILPLDHRRKLVIVQRDTVQHLLVLGPNGETLVESGFESRQDEKQKDIHGS